MKHVLFGTLVLLLLLIGAGALIAPLLVKGGAIPFVNGVVGGSCLMAAVGFAVPLRVKKLFETISPYIPLVRPTPRG